MIINPYINLLCDAKVRAKTHYNSSVQDQELT